MSAQRSQQSLSSALARLVCGRAGIPMEKLEQCDGCRRMFSLREVELVGPQILCCDCAPAEFTATLHPHLPAHPRLRADVRL
ncbi:MAG: hypothetical protein HZA92_19515 [Verrucomicrobia bacterium]|nr:hypothetical protein [Verrucomicrobiota bacterium]